MSDMEMLADRVEALTGPCRETDAEIARALGALAVETTGSHGSVFWSETLSEPLPAYTASVDSAMALISEGHKQPSDIVRAALSALGEKFRLHIMWWPLITPYPEYLARFITAAALRALSHTAKGGEG